MYVYLYIYTYTYIYNLLLIYYPVALVGIQYCDYLDSMLTLLLYCWDSNFYYWGSMFLLLGFYITTISSNILIVVIY